ncbi:MAG: hypothetical protein B7C54_06175 [Acidimicrobiales bacterium mtb01]|nr:pilus assembly protein [Actinomycetota bacterium]TEX46775.1 MAG: hypothetical protein B7C54_06175 [Acidimicrobiales bacterium mtb01]
MTTRRSSVRDRGSVAVEVVLLTPVLIVFTLFAVFGGRATEAMSDVRHAADQGARAASMVSRARMEMVARDAVLTDLRNRNITCSDPGVVTSLDPSRRFVTVAVTCRPDDRDLGLLNASMPELHASSTEVIDTYRGGD